MWWTDLLYTYVDVYSFQLWVLKRDEDQLIPATPADLRNTYIPLWSEEQRRIAEARTWSRVQLAAML